MWNRLLRLLTTGLNVYSFYANPVRYIISTLMIILIPCLIYIFWGSLMILALIAVTVYFLHRSLTSQSGRSYS